MKRYISAVFFALLGLIIACQGAGLQAAWAKDLVRVGDGPYISGGGLYIARDKGYFDKMGVDIVIKPFIDATLAMPSLIAGELDIAFQGAAANLFNAIAKGAPLVIFLDRGNNRVGSAYTVSVVTQSLYDQGVRTLADLAKLKGKRIGVSGVGSINQYSLSLALMKAGINPAKDVEWIVNVAQPDLMRMLGQQQLDAIGAAYNIAMFVEDNKWGKIVGTDDEVAPGGQIGIYVVDKRFLAQRRDVLVRWTMAYLQGVKDFGAAAGDPDKYPDIVAILAKNTSLNKPELVKAIAPHWSHVSENGEPNVASVMAMQDFWSGPYFQFVEKKLSREQLFDLSVAKEAKERLDREKPFGP